MPGGMKNPNGEGRGTEVIALRRAERRFPTAHPERMIILGWETTARVL
jgi:hypothetical protein